jgi:hypothetical protein
MDNGWENAAQLNAHPFCITEKNTVVQMVLQPKSKPPKAEMWYSKKPYAKG